MTNKVDFSNLGANLSEIVYSLKSYIAAESLDLYAGSASAVSFQGTWMGTGYKIFNKCVRWIKLDFSTQDPNQALENIILHQFTDAIRTIYRLKCKYIAIQVKRMEKAIPNLPGNCAYSFKAYLQNEKIPDGMIEECVQAFVAATDSNEVEEIEGVRQSVKSFFSAVHLFWTTLFLAKHEILIKPILSIVSKGSLIKDHHVYSSLFRLLMSVNLEGLMRHYLPITELAKLVYEQKLTAVESAKIGSWLNAINYKRSIIIPHEFECALRDIAAIISIALQIPDCYEKLLLKLDALDCKILRLNDSKHILERQKYQPGTIISCNGIGFAVGRQLSPEKPNDQTKVFALEGHDNYVIKIANNLFSLIIENQKVKIDSEHWGIRPVEMALNGLDNNGGCVILEKLHTSLSEYIWTSCTPILSEQDQITALVIANHLICWQQNNAVPANISLNHLMFDANGNLKSLKLLKKEAGDYGKWENFAFEVSKGNVHVLNFIMRVSKLYEHNVAKYYREPIANTFAAGEVVLPATLGSREEKYKLKLLELSQRASRLAEETFNEIVLMRCNDNNFDEIVLKLEIFGKLKALYSMSPTAGIVSDSLKKDLITHYRETQQLTLYQFEKQLVSQFYEQSAYYQEQYELLMKNNKTARQEKDEDDSKA